MGGTDKESRKDYLLLYEKGKRGIRRCKILMEELERIEGDSSVCKESRKELEGRMREYGDMCRRVLASVDCLEGVEKDVAILRYIEGMPWKKIADKMGYSMQHVYRIHNRAIGSIVPH